MKKPTLFLVVFTIIVISYFTEKEKSDFSKIQNRRDLKNKSISEDNVGEHISKREKYSSINDIAFESVVDL